MYGYSIIIVASFARLVLSYAVQPPVAHDRIIRRCDNETHSLFWPYSNGSLTQSPYDPEIHGSAGSGLLTAGPSTGYPIPQPCGGYGGFPCFPTGTNGPTAEATASSDISNASWTQSTANASANTPSQSFDVGPHMTWTAFSPLVQSAISTISETVTASGTSLSGNDSTDSTGFSSATSTDHGSEVSSIQSNPTTSTESSSDVVLTSLTSNATATTLYNHTRTIGSSQPFVSPCRNSLGSSCSFGNATYIPTGSGTGGWGPRWTNASSYPPQSDASPPGTASQDLSELVATITIDLTPSPEEITLTATVNVGGVQTSSRAVGNVTEYTSTTSSATASSQENGLITMTIVVANNSTDILGTQTGSPTNPTSTLVNSSVSEPASTISGDNSSAANVSVSPPPTTEATSGVSVGLFTTLAENSTMTSLNGTLAETATITTPYWSNTTSSAPCTGNTSHSNLLWGDWSLTAPSFTRDNNSSSSVDQTSSSQTVTANNTNTSPESTVATSSSVSSLGFNLSTSESDNLVTPTTLPANTSISSQTLEGSPTLSNSVASPSLNPNASTICLINATVASCPSTAAPWLSTAAVIGTVGGSGGSTLTTSFVSAPNGSFSSAGGPLGQSLVPLKQAQARSVRKDMAHGRPSPTHDGDSASRHKVHLQGLDENVEEGVVKGGPLGWVRGHLADFF
ncbi:hypothetical protein A1O3_09031 [Capronia epimyces CBS 606.96]|uniref:Ig-like domain-containing protein n=1 Tax=Capronia epimyces CBS 606.96 TaxID=1182542 RepID=W9XBN6_9EURO|nr:uncharacterized protein A1O3_09031 [Capronia epimyces CBS 606.96]EXJ77872.1 hypothetical protein A1O3_09031 [Capronia epimyces CBS 606.96]